MGLKNFGIVCMGCLTAYIVAFYTILYERQCRYRDFINLGFIEETFPYLTLLSSVILSEIMVLLSLMSAAINREQPWDNSTPRAIEERQKGISYRFNCAHMNEGEQFKYICGAIIISMMYYNKDNDINKDEHIIFINTYCLGYILHRIGFHIFFALNINELRSICYHIAQGYYTVLLCSNIFGIQRLNQFLDDLTPTIFTQWIFRK